MFRYAGCRLDGQNVFTGQRLPAAKPFRNGALSDLKKPRHRRLRANLLDCFAQGIQFDRCRIRFQR